MIGPFSKTTKLSDFYDENYEIKKQSKKNKTVNSSTLSLHITAYENAIENDKTDDNENYEKYDSFKKWNNDEQFTQGLSSDFQGPFEFPRQQENEAKIPEQMQFKASQRLLNPNGSGSGSGIPHDVEKQQIIAPPSEKINHDGSPTMLAVKARTSKHKPLMTSTPLPTKAPLNGTLECSFIYGPSETALSFSSNGEYMTPPFTSKTDNFSVTNGLPPYISTQMSKYDAEVSNAEDDLLIAE
uniref:Uncharacterized protein n=1 Tax=Panagrolaimus sp. ES5 TaxID=591445 RepID=A0AC34FNJ2_9BILA